MVASFQEDRVASDLRVRDAAAKVERKLFEMSRMLVRHGSLGVEISRRLEGVRKELSLALREQPGLAPVNFPSAVKVPKDMKTRTCACGKTIKGPGYFRHLKACAVAKSTQGD